MLVKLIISVYLIYVTFFYRTCSNFSLSFQNYSQSTIPGLYHSVTNELSNKICLLGKLAAAVLVGMIWIFGLDHVFVHCYTFGLVLAGIIMNLNFAIYILPILLVQLYLYIDSRRLSVSL